MEKPLVTIIVVSYNHGRFIRENLESIRNQTYENIELIVGDDASKDNSVEIFEQWLQENNYPAERNFHAENTGLATMLNECITLAKGKYIKLIAADDFLHQEAIEKYVSRLESSGEKYGMVFSNTHTVDDNSFIVKDFADYDSLGNIDPHIFRKELIKGNRIAALTVLLKTDVIKETGKYDTRFIVEDYFRWLKISEKYLIAYIPEKLTYYRMHPQNTSKIKAEKIELETTQLQIMFDLEGTVKDKVNAYTHRYYLSGKKLPEDYINVYHHYPFKIKRLDWAIRSKIPPLFYKVINKIAEIK